MLDLCVMLKAFDKLWEQLELHVRPPDDLVERERFRRGPLPAAYDERRRHPRFYFWRKAILQRDDRFYAAYTRNLSKSGLALLNPRQIFPGERAQLLLATGETLDVEVRRCRRLAEDCYECGAQIVALKRAEAE